jgi:hypothetical protein
MTMHTSTPSDASATSGHGRRIAVAGAWVASGAIAATALTGVAFASGRTTPADVATTTATSATSATATGFGSSAATGRRAGLLRTVLHGTFTVQGASGPTEVTLQRGHVTAASATSLTVASSDGFSATYAITSSTVVKRDRAAVTGDKLVVGDTAVVRASAGTATVVRDLSPAAAAKIGSRLGQGGSAGSGTGASPSSSATS